MSVQVQDTAVFFLRFPDLMTLCGISLTLQDDEEEPRTKQIRTCRELLLLFSDVLASPAVDSFKDITVIMAIPFFQKGVVQAFGRRHQLKVTGPLIVSPVVLQCCLSFSLVNRLSPRWNKAGRYLVCGHDFLSVSGTLNAVSMELSTSQGQMYFSIKTNAVRLPPSTLQDLDLPPLVLRRFCTDQACVLDLWANAGPIWCHVLPSMKKGQIMSISRQLPKDGPFRTYGDLQSHWNHLYGYRLPDVPEDDVVYCSIYFRPVGDKLFTYPLSCVRMHPVQHCSHGNLQGTLSCFLSDLREKLQKVCGLSMRLSSHPEVKLKDTPTAQVKDTPTAQVWSHLQVNPQVLTGSQVTLSSSSSMRPLLTPLPVPPLAPPLKPFFSSQRPSWVPPSQSLSSSDFSEYDPPSSCPPSVFQPASSLISSSLATPVPPPLPPKLVPIFKNKHPSHHVNVALLRVQRQKDQLTGGDNCTGVTLPTSSTHVPSFLPVSSFNRCQKTPPMSSIVRFAPSFIPKTKSKTALVRTVKPDSRRKPQETLDQTSSSSKKKAESPSDPSSSSKVGAVEVRPTVKDVEKMARRNQLWKVNSVTLRLWLRGRGLDVDVKLQKTQLMLKVMGCLGEA